MTGGEDDKAANDAVLSLNETCQFRRGGKPPAKTIPPARIGDVAELIVERPTRLEGIRRLLPDEARLPIQNRLVVPVRANDEPSRPLAVFGLTTASGNDTRLPPAQAR